MKICKGLEPITMEGKFPIRICWGCKEYKKKPNCYYLQPSTQYWIKLNEKLKKERLERELQEARAMVRE